MVAALSHEVAQPLAAISNYAASSSALLKPEASKKPENLEQVRQHIDQIAQQSRRAADIIYRLRDYSRKSAPQRVSCDLNELLRKSVEMVSLELRGADVNLNWDLAVGLPPIAGDPLQLQQVIVNLLLNARDSLLESGALSRKIALRSRVDLGKVVIEVEDNGSGMSEEIAGRLYEPFVTTKLQGMGIGLNICRSILQEHRGEIDYHQVASGGVLFRVSLPLTEASTRDAPGVPGPGR
jgi:two-component system sensor histidine kinase DctS